MQSTSHPGEQWERLDLVMSLASRTVVLNFGSKLAEGTPEEVRSNPKVIEA